MKAESPRIATHLGPFGSGGDRYNLKGYRAADAIEERIRLASTVKGLSGIELNFRGLVNEDNAATFKVLLDEVGLACANVSMNVWGEAKWAQGSLSNPNPAIRQDAKDLIIAGMQTTKKLGGHLVSLWPGQDGFDYPFEADYAQRVDCFIEGLQACARAVPDVRICVEYKPKEPRTHSLIDTAARIMWLLSKVDAKNVGVLLDVGHSLYAGENVAESAVLLQREGILDLIHFNDNYGEWDWDMIPGSVRFWELLELIFWLRETGYHGWYSIDISTPRMDPVKAIQQSVTNIERLDRIADRLDRETILTNLEHGTAEANLALLSDRVMQALGG